MGATDRDEFKVKREAVFEFAEKPTITREGDRATITFETKSLCDVTVAIEDCKARIVRHLAAGVLGPNAPAPFQRNSRTQAIEWDLRDDTGRPVQGGPFKVRVCLGLKAEFDRFIGWKARPPLDYVLINAMAVTPDRKVYVIGISRDAPRSGRSENRIWVLSPDGRYKETIYPFPATMDPARLSGVDLLSQEKNRLQPRIYDRVCVSLLPQMRAVNRQTMDVTSDGRLLFTNGWGTELYSFGPRVLMAMRTDGSIPRERIDGPAFGPGVKAGYSHLALTPDEKSVYVCGMAKNVSLRPGAHLAEPGKDDNVVYRVGLEVQDKPEIIFGTLGTPAAGREGLNEPRGLAVDGRGRVYVSDFGNDRIVVLESTGRYVGEIPLVGPGVISVHPKSGAIYAISMPKPKRTYRLVRIAGLEEPTVACEVDLTRFGGVYSRKTHVGYHPVIALDPYGAKPVLYIGNPQIYGRYRLLRVVDDGAAFKVEKVDLSSDGEVKGLPYPQGTDRDGNFYFRGLGGTINYDRYIRAYRYSPDTDRIETTPLKYTGVIGEDGLLYFGKYQGTAVRRVNLSGEIVPFSKTGEWSAPYNKWRFYDKRSSFDVLPSGDIWALASNVDEKPFRARVVNLAPDGSIKRKDVVIGLQGPAGLRVNSRGDIYVADGLTPDGRPYPPKIDAFAKRLRTKGTSERGRHSEAVEDSYGEAYGSILKFAASGGKIRKLGKGETLRPGEIRLSAYPHEVKFAAKGLAGIYPRISPMSPPRYDYPYSACWCLFPIFDLDGHGRLFVPDAMQFCVRVLDGNFNEILTFGGYDKATAEGGKDNLPAPKIPFEFPTYAHASDDAVYVTDSAPCARRVVRVKLTYATTATVSLPNIISSQEIPRRD